VLLLAGHQFQALVHSAAGYLIRDDIASTGQLARQVRTLVSSLLLPGSVCCGSAKSWQWYSEFALMCVLTSPDF
jgi:hypothetical protein